MFQAIRIKIVKGLIDINEKIFFERRLFKFYKKLLGKSIQMVIDVGANKGQSIDFFLRLNANCKISAFEPNLTLYNRLLVKYKKFSNISIYNAGISEHAGEKMFQENVLDYTSTFEELNLNSKYLLNKSNILGVKPEDIIKNKYMVNTMTLSDFINENVKDTIDVLKIDIEGHEYAALKGLFRLNAKYPIRYIQIEEHVDDMYLNKIPFGRINELLAANGFVIHTIIKHGFGKINEIIFYNTNNKPVNK
jgi:FkbM family methyltransferase